jgi:hypothetical protein
MTAFLDVAPCCLLEVDRRFRSACCLHLQHDDECTSLKRRSSSMTILGAVSQKVACRLHTRGRENLKSQEMSAAASGRNKRTYLVLRKEGGYLTNPC